MFERFHTGQNGNSGIGLAPVSYTHLDVYKRQVLAHQEGTDTAVLLLEGKLLQSVINIQSYMYKLIEMEDEKGNHDNAEKIAEITDHMICFFFAFFFTAGVLSSSSTSALR